MKFNDLAACRAAAFDSFAEGADDCLDTSAVA